MIKENKPILVAVGTGFGSYIADIVLYPLDIVTNKLRTCQHIITVRECIKGIWKSEGIFY